MKRIGNLGKVMALMAVMIMITDVSLGIDVSITKSINWSAIKSGTGGGVPTSDDVIIISSNVTLTVDVANAVCKSINIGGGGNGNNNNGILTINSNSMLTVNGLVQYITSRGTNQLNLSTGSTLICQGFTGTSGTNTINGTIQLTATNTLPSIFTSFYSLIISAGTTTLGTGTTVSGILTINSGATLTLNGTLTVKGNWTNNGNFTANTSTVVFDGSAQTISNGTFNNLTLSGSGLKTLTTVTVTGILSMEGTATVSQAPTYGSAATLQYNTSTDRINGIEWPTAFTATGGVLIKNTGKITLDKARTYTLSKLTIDPGFLIIPAGGQVSVTGDTKITSANGLTIESVSEVSGGAGTGSFITGTTSGSGTASVIRYMSPRSWHMVSSPVSGQTITGFLGSNGNIPKNVAPGAPTELHVERGMRDYNPSINQWNSFFTDETTGSIEKGKGFLVRVKGSTGTKDVTFSGTLNAGPLSATGLTSNLWNCVGNPYTSALKLNINSGTDNFIDGNTANLDMTYGGIYIWHQSNEVLDDDQATGAYEAVSNASLATEVQQGQAFMVKMASTASTLNFTYAMQSHNTGLALKSTNNIWPTIKLTATSDSITSSTIIAFHEGMTPGLDPTYDAGLLKGGASVEVYTRLVEDNGIPFDIQALPANFESTVVPVGIDCTKGSQVSFSAELMHVPSNCQAILEDRLTDTFTDLSVNSYTADLKGSASSQDRFFLHTSYATTGIDSRNRIQQLRAWAISNQEIKISGQVGNKAIATLYDLQGRTVAICPLQAGNLNRVPLNGLKQGVFMLRVQDDQRAQVLKVIIQK